MSPLGEDLRDFARSLSGGSEVVHRTAIALSDARSVQERVEHAVRRHGGREIYKHSRPQVAIRSTRHEKRHVSERMCTVRNLIGQNGDPGVDKLTSIHHRYGRQLVQERLEPTDLYLIRHAADLQRVGTPVAMGAQMILR